MYSWEVQIEIKFVLRYQVDRQSAHKYSILIRKKLTVNGIIDIFDLKLHVRFN